ncbi:MAG: hypothetical protein LBD23_16180 [Oscillospiraceae bacterium]|jgi:hypothetical protein|nr:hypothetical protein [Oscillospiraceae bacterium]
MSKKIEENRVKDIAILPADILDEPYDGINHHVNKSVYKEHEKQNLVIPDVAQQKHNKPNKNIFVIIVFLIIGLFLAGAIFLLVMLRPSTINEVPERPVNIQKDHPPIVISGNEGDREIIRPPSSGSNNEDNNELDLKTSELDDPEDLTVVIPPLNPPPLNPDDIIIDIHHADDVSNIDPNDDNPTITPLKFTGSADLLGSWKIDNSNVRRAVFNKDNFAYFYIENEIISAHYFFVLSHEVVQMCDVIGADFSEITRNCSEYSVAVRDDKIMFKSEDSEFSISK